LVVPPRVRKRKNDQSAAEKHGKAPSFMRKIEHFGENLPHILHIARSKCAEYAVFMQLYKPELIPNHLGALGTKPILI
jgi:hypothetical protein